ncbi:alpha/beta hydrolase-fold protein [Sphingobacterium siyangense]|uniref:alpha/beta hydrolase-fold protein n=1 Tax=Sphingobacterium siyangense TaxID=459529 RepID=UPI001964616B|nr:alpha/beta hydrolase-fold protein [Sphingobacterium siyangense]QRY57327.1 hypothetical protein JVX97_25585 [Sphingobacterium siyangense]
MRKIYLLFILSLWTSVMIAQVKVFQESLYAPELLDTISYKVYLPQDWDGWDNTQRHPAIYAVNYGMVNGDFIAQQIAYFRKARYEIPNSLVVVIDANMERMGYQYETGDITIEGQHFVSFIKNQLIPTVTRKYHTSTFATYLGHSFAASFGSYLLRSDPELFNGYILLAPEKVGREKPFRLTEDVLNAYNKQYTFVYSGVGEKDMQRRRDFAREIGREMSRASNDYLFFTYDSLPRADHTNILSMTMEFALKSIYRFYTPYEDKEESNAFAALQQTADKLKRYYGLDPERNFTFYRPFANEAVNNKDTLSLKKVLAYFNGPNLKGWNLMQFGEFCLRLDMKPLAEAYFQQAIKKIETQEMNLSTGPPNLLVCYQHLAFDIHSKNPPIAWMYLLKAKDVALGNSRFIPHDGSVLLNLGKYAAQTGYQPEEALEYLTSYRQGRYNYNYLAAYYQSLICQRNGKKKLAVRYVQQGLEENPEDADLIRLAKELGLNARAKSSK